MLEIFATFTLSFSITCVVMWFYNMHVRLNNLSDRVEYLECIINKKKGGK